MFQFRGQLPPYVFARTQAAKEKVAQAQEVIDLGMGNPDGAPPSPIINQLLATATLPTAHRYGPPLGIPELRADVANWYRARFNMTVSVDDIVLTHGAKEALSQLAMTLITPGDVVLVPTPCYPIHKFAFELAGARVIEIPLVNKAEYFSALKDAFKKYPVKGVLVNFPHNPTGITITDDEAKSIAELCLSHKVWCVHDFAYAELYFDEPPPSILKYMPVLGVEILSMSKSYNMAGWRLGFAVGTEDIMQPFARVKSYLGYGSFMPLQYGAHAAFSRAQGFLHEMRQTYRARRDAFVDALNKDVSVDAGMFVWWQVGGDDLSYVLDLVEQTGVLLAPGSGFGEGGKGFVRAALIESPDVLKMAAEKINQFNSAEVKYA